MDYAYDVCQSVFTYDQRNLMIDTLENIRNAANGMDIWSCPSTGTCDMSENDCGCEADVGVTTTTGTPTTQPPPTPCCDPLYEWQSGQAM